MEIIDYIVLGIIAWGILGALCLLYIGIKKDIKHYFKIKRRLK